MLTSVRLENFKCFELLELQPRRITVLIGPNGAGKSSVLQALMFLRQSLGQEEPQWQGPFVNLVGSGTAERELAIVFEGERALDGTRLGFAYRATFSDEGLTANIGGVKWGSQQLYVEWHRGKSQDETKVGFDYYSGRFEYEVTGSPVIGKPHGSVVPSVSGPAQGQEEAMQIQRRLLETVPDAIQSWRFGPPVRGFLQHGYELAPNALDEIHPAVSYDSNASGIATSLAYENETRDRVAALIERITGVSIEHALLEGPSVSVNAHSPIGGRVPIVNEGFATNQLTFLMYQLVKTPEVGLAGIEEPEAHLHPYAIARLGDEFVKVATQEHKQLLLATHSDHLLLSLLNNVAERKLAADELAIYYFWPEDGKVKVRRQEVTPDGLVKGGLPGFFDAALEAQRRHLDAVTKHQPLEAIAQQP